MSGSRARSYAGGEGRHATIYANKGHVYLEVAGLRLDTEPGRGRRRPSGLAVAPR